MTMARRFFTRFLPCVAMAPAVSAFVGSKDKGKPLQIVKLGSGCVQKLKLNEKNLETILLHPDVKDKPVVIVSVVGAYKTGKSFLLGFLLKYFEEGINGNDWLCDDDVIEGFEMGYHTGASYGIHLWSKPFIMHLEPEGQVAVLLMDTQGIGNSAKPRSECARIFALSSLISSVQIFNIMQDVTSHHLQDLETFTEYGRSLTETLGHFGAKLQKQRVFLIRDSRNESPFLYGEDGGEAYIKYIAANDSRHEEKKIFDQSILKCFLLPYPGKAVATQSSRKVNEMDADFLNQIKNFGPFIKSVIERLPKTLRDRFLKGEDMIEFIRILVNGLGKHPDLQSETEMSSEHQRKKILKEALDCYETLMKDFFNPEIQHDKLELEFEKHHHYAEELAMELFYYKHSTTAMHSDSPDLTELKRQISEKHHLYELEMKNFKKLQEENDWFWNTLNRVISAYTVIDYLVRLLTGNK